MNLNGCWYRIAPTGVSACSSSRSEDMKAAVLASMILVLAGPALADTIHIAPPQIQPAGVRVDVGPRYGGERYRGGDEFRHHDGGYGEGDWRWRRRHCIERGWVWRDGRCFPRWRHGGDEY
jgi:hypothetical protein